MARLVRPDRSCISRSARQGRMSTEGQRFDALNLRRREGKQDGTGESTPADQYRRQYQSRGLARSCGQCRSGTGSRSLERSLRVRSSGRTTDKAAKNLWSEGTSSFRTGLEIAEILADLKLDQDSLVAAILYRGVREGHIQLPAVSQRFGPVVAKLIDGVQRMAAISASLSPRQSLVLGSQARWKPAQDARGHGRRRSRCADQTGRAHLRDPCGENRR